MCVVVVYMCGVVGVYMVLVCVVVVWMCGVVGVYMVLVCWL